MDVQKIKRELRAEIENDLKRKWGQLPPPQPTGQIQDEMSKRARKRAANKANKAAGGPLAILNGGVGDGSGGGKGGGPGAGKGNKKGKGKGKGKGSKTSDGKPICFNWNNGTACKNPACTMAHVCLKCHSPDHRQCDNQC